jgi:hypothetical protein
MHYIKFLLKGEGEGRREGLFERNSIFSNCKTVSISDHISGHNITHGPGLEASAERSLVKEAFL